MLDYTVLVYPAHFTSSALFNAVFMFHWNNIVRADLSDQLATLRQEHERVIGQKRQLERELAALDPVCSFRVKS